MYFLNFVVSLSFTPFTMSPFAPESSVVGEYYRPCDVGECWFLYLDFLRSDGPVYLLKSKNSTSQFMHWWRWFQAVMTTFHIDVASMLVSKWRDDVLHLRSEEELIVRGCIDKSVQYRRGSKRLFALTAQEELWCVFQECGFIIRKEDVIEPFKFTIAFSCSVESNLKRWYKSKLMHNIAGARINEEAVCDEIVKELEGKESPYSARVVSYCESGVKKSVSNMILYAVEENWWDKLRQVVCCK